jgi:MoxR-like ATPase
MSAGDRKPDDSVRHAFARLASQLRRQVIGQDALIDGLLIGLLAAGHLLLEGPPGVAKTRAVRILAGLIDADFHRIQFTPDLMPADLTGGEVFRPQDGSFRFERGPIFHSILLADEINRAPAKVQSALLEAMGEGQVSIGQASYPLPPLFMVLATQNPIEHEGTYPLPEAQLDRFVMKLSIDYPAPQAEREILALARAEAQAVAKIAVPAAPTSALLGIKEVFAARREVLELHLAPALEGYIVDLVAATRRPETLDPALAGSVRYGASPRGAIALERCARAHAWLAGRDYVSPADIQAMLLPVLGHRVLLSYEAEARGDTPDALLRNLMQRLPVP